MKSLVALVFILSITPALAGDNHNHEAAVEAAPHGGVLRDTTIVAPKAAPKTTPSPTQSTTVSPYKAELVLEKDLAKIYVYTKSGDKLVPATLTSKEIKGYVRLPKDKKDKALTFKKTGEVFQATIAGISKVHRFDLHANIEENGQTYLLDFGIDNIH